MRREQYTAIFQAHQSANTTQWVLFTFCCLNEVFFIALYLLSFSSPFLSPTLFADSANPPP